MADDPVQFILTAADEGALLEHILELASAETAATSIATARAWAAAGTSDAVWRGKCERLWSDKVCVPERFRAGGGLSRLAAYWGSIEDAKRCAITPEELCSMRWSSRMKGWAGGSWTDEDPWWNGQPAAERQYHADGTTSGGGRGNGTWRFVPESCGREGPLGSFVRHGRDGREFPTHFVSRHAPNWGWVMQNCWGFSASFPLPPRGVAPELEDESELVRSVSVETCHKEASRFNMGLPLPYENGRDEDGDPDGPMFDSDDETETFDFSGSGGAGGAGQQLVELEVGGQRMAVPASVLVQLMARLQQGGSAAGGEASAAGEGG